LGRLVADGVLGGDIAPLLGGAFVDVGRVYTRIRPWVIRVGWVRMIMRIWVWCVKDEAGTHRSRLDDEAGKDPIGWRLSSRSEGDHRLTHSVARILKMREDNSEDRESSK
jgi:hypothetical protein